MFKGDVVLIPLSYPNRSDDKMKLVPALILSEDEGAATVAFISTKTEEQEPCDLILHPKKGNGLHARSVVRLNKIITIEKSFILGRLGTLSTREMRELNLRLLELFDLNY